MAELMDHFEKEYNLEIQLLMNSFFANKKKVEEKKKMSMSKISRASRRRSFHPISSLSFWS